MQTSILEGKAHKRKEKNEKKENLWIRYLGGFVDLLLLFLFPS